MPEVPSSASPAPAAAPSQPVTPVVAPPAPALAPEEALRREKIAAYRVKEKFEAEKAGWQNEKKTLGEKLSKLGELEKRESMAKRNPVEFMKHHYGDKWYDVLVEARMNGVPPADLIAGEIDKARDEFKSELAKRDEAATAKEAARAKAEVETARREQLADAQDWYAANTKEYPIFEALGLPDAVAKTIAQRIEGTYHATTKRDESGRVVQHGRVMSVKEAADGLEADLLGLAEKMTTQEKYAARLREKLQPLKPAATVATQQAAVTQVVGQQRSSPSNDSGSAAARQPAVTLAQKRERAIAAFEAARTGKP